MKIYVKTNNKIYNMSNVMDFYKLDDDKIVFLKNNNTKKIEIYSSQDERDDTYNKIVNEYVLDTDS